MDAGTLIEELIMWREFMVKFNTRTITFILFLDVLLEREKRHLSLSQWRNLGTCILDYSTPLVTYGLDSGVIKFIEKNRNIDILPIENLNNVISDIKNLKMKKEIIIINERSKVTNTLKNDIGELKDILNKIGISNLELVYYLDMLHRKRRKIEESISLFRDEECNELKYINSLVKHHGMSRDKAGFIVKECKYIDFASDRGYEKFILKLKKIGW